MKKGTIIMTQHADTTRTTFEPYIDDFGHDGIVKLDADVTQGSLKCTMSKRASSRSTIISFSAAVSIRDSPLLVFEIDSSPSCYA